MLRRTWDKKRSSGKIFVRTIAATIFTAALAGLPPTTNTQAQPITIPALTPPAFNQTDFDPYFTAARLETSVPAWQLVIEQAGIVLGAQWEAQVDAQIAAELAAVSQSDAFNSANEYRDYLNRELQVQKQSAFANWELQAQTAIENERNLFLTGLASLDPSQTGADAERAIDVGRSDAAAGQRSATDSQSFDELEDSINGQETDWREQFTEDYEAGLYQYAQALAGIEQQYTDFVQTLAQKDAEFQANINQIQAFEDNVRAGIGAQLTVLENTLQTNGVFHAETCDGENVCTLDSNTLNASGTQLQALITSMRTGLQNGASLTNLSNQMITYLQTSRAQAEADRQNWQDLSTQTENLPVFGVALGGLRDPAVFSIPEVAAIDQYFGGFHGGVANIVRQRSGQPAYRSISINSANAQGYTPPGLLPIQIPIISTVNQQGEWYSSVLRRALEWEHVIVIGIDDPIVNRFAESELRLHITYTWHDANAQSNRDRWAGYVNDLDGMLAQWQNTILPAATAWETQKNTYAANYATWQTQAQAQQAAALATTRQNRDLVIASRNQFITTSTTQFRNGQNAWREIKKDVTAARDAAGDFGASQANIIDRIQQIGGAPGVGDDLSEIQRNLGALPQPSQEFLSLSRAPLPDLKNLETVGNGLRTSLIGASNYSLTSATQESFERERSKVRKMLKEMLETSRLANTSSGDIAVSLFMQRLEPAQLAQLQGMKADELSRHINGTLGLATDGDLTVSAVQRFAQLYGVEFEKPIHELINERRADAQNAIWHVQEIDGGKLRATRQIKDGNAFLRFGADGTKDDSYISGQQEQVMEFAAPAVMKLATTDGLFEAWETKTILNNFGDQLDEFAVHSKQQRADVWNAGTRADAYRSAKDRQFRQSAQNQAFIASIIKAALTSALTGGNAIEGASGVVRGRIMGPIYSALETATGIPAGIWGSLAGGADLEQAVISYGFSMVEEATGVPGLASMLQQEWGKMQARQARRQAQRFRPEDMFPAGPLTYGFSQLAYSSNPLVANYGRAMAGATSPTYAWRNAQHHDDGAVALQAVETVGAVALQTVGSIIPGLGNAGATAIIAAYQAAKQGYLGSLNGGTRGALAGVASGVVGGVVRHYTAGMANVGFSYSYEDGFGVSARASVPLIGNADTGLALGFGATWNEHEGITGSSASLGFQHNLGPDPGGPGLFAGVNYSSESGVNAAIGIQDSNEVGSASAAFTYSPDEGYGAAVNFGIAGDSDLPQFLSSGGGTLSYTENSGLSASYASDPNAIDQFELSYNERDGFEGTFSAPGGEITYGPDGLSVRPSAQYWLDHLEIIPELEVAGFDLGYDPEKGFTANLPGDGEDVFAWNQTDGASSPYLESLEQQARETIDEIESAGGLREQLEAISGVMQNPGDYMDLDPFGGESPFEELPDLSGIFGEEENGNSGTPDGGGGEEIAGGGEPDGEEIAGGGAPDGGEIVGHRGGGYTTPDGFRISKLSKSRVEEVKAKFQIEQSQVKQAKADLANCKSMPAPSASAGDSQAAEQALIAQINCLASIPGPPDNHYEGPLNIERLGSQSYSEDFINFVQIETNEAKMQACRQAGKGSDECTLTWSGQVNIDYFSGTQTHAALKAEASGIKKLITAEAEKKGTTAPDKTPAGLAFFDSRGKLGGFDKPSSQTGESFANEWLSKSESGKRYAEFSKTAIEAELLRRQAEKRLFALAYKEKADEEIKKTDLGGLGATAGADRDVGLVQGFAEEAYEYAVQLKNSVVEFTKGLAEDVQKQYTAFRNSLDRFIEDPLTAVNFFDFMEKTSDLGGNPVLMPVMSLPPTGQVLGRAVSVADLVTAVRKGDPAGLGLAAWGLLSGTKTGDLIEGRVKGAAGSVKDQISKSKLGEQLAAATEAKFKKINMMPCPSCKGCLAVGTPVLTPVGYRPIESLRVGDTVIAYDTEAGKQVERKVTHLHRDITIEWYDIQVGADTLTVTDNHPFWLPESGEWVEARSLEVGAVLHPQDGPAARISQINVRKLRQSEPIYNVEIEGEHNYFAGEGAVLVHNGGGNGNCRNGLPCSVSTNFGKIDLDKLPSQLDELFDTTKAASGRYKNVYFGKSPNEDVAFAMSKSSDGRGIQRIDEQLETYARLEQIKRSGKFNFDVAPVDPRGRITLPCRDGGGTCAGYLIKKVGDVDLDMTPGSMTRLLNSGNLSPKTRLILADQIGSLRKMTMPPNFGGLGVGIRDIQARVDLESGRLFIIDPANINRSQKSREDSIVALDRMVFELKRKLPEKELAALRKKYPRVY